MQQLDPIAKDDSASHGIHAPRIPDTEKDRFGERSHRFKVDPRKIEKAARESPSAFQLLIEARHLEPLLDVSDDFELGSF
jgi:hypothetical protein